MRKCLDCDKDLVDAKGPKKRCDICNKEHRKLYLRARENNPKRKQQNLERQKRFYHNNKDKRKEYSKKYRNGSTRQKYLANKKRNSYKRYHNNIQTKLSELLRTRLYMALKAQGLQKNNSTMELVGCSKEELIQHLESQFKDGMCWQNWSLNGWHIDHIRPVSSFDLSDPAQVKECFHFSNLQPLWAIENLQKSNSWDEGPQDDIFF